MKYEDFVKDSMLVDEADCTKPIEELFVEYCEYIANNINDFEIGEIRSVLSRVDEVAKNIAIKHLQEKGYNLENVGYVLNTSLYDERTQKYIGK